MRSVEVETLLAQVSELTRAPYETYKALVNGELTFGSVTDADGAEIAINQTSIMSLLRDESRPLREAAWRQYADGYLRQRKTLAGLLERDDTRGCLLRPRTGLSQRAGRRARPRVTPTRRLRSTSGLVAGTSASVASVLESSCACARRRPTRRLGYRRPTRAFAPPHTL